MYSCSPATKKELRDKARYRDDRSILAYIYRLYSV